MGDSARLQATVYIGGLDNAVDERILSDAFLPFGEIVEVSIPKPDSVTSPEPHRGFGYVEFELASDAREAIDNMDQSELLGRVIKVAQAKPQKASNEGLGSKTAVWEQEAWIAKYGVANEDNQTETVTGGTEPNEQQPLSGLEALDVAGPKQL